MQTYSIREAVEMAVRTEKLGVEFYTSMAGKFESERGLKDLFALLATMEMKHERVFTGLMEKIKDDVHFEWEEAQNYFRAMMQSQFFFGAGKSLPSMDGVTTALEAVDFAIGFEKETILYFLGIRDAVAEADRALVDEVMAEETRHIAMLTKFRETISS